MNLGLTDRVVLVTGASGAIGAAIARAYASEGALVAASWHRNEDKATTLAESITRAGGTAMPVHLDQADAESVHAAVRRISREFGDVTVLAANAVAWPSRDAETADGRDHVFSANTAGTLAVIDAVLPGMRAAGWGRLVLVSSDVVDQPMPWNIGYPASKGALESAAKVLAVREAEHGVLTNVVRPGFTLTDRALSTPGFGRQAVDAEAAKTPTGRICTPDDVASAVTYLGSGANGHCNGEVLSVAGGRHLTR